MTERKKGSVADALTTVWFIVLSAWCFLNDYTLTWLIGLGGGIGGYLVVRWVWLGMDRGGK